jgi:hypothetical protein
MKPTTKPKFKLEFYGQNNNTRKYKTFTLIPTIEFDIDTQFSDIFMVDDEKILGGITEYILIVRFLNFSFHLALVKSL